VSCPVLAGWLASGVGLAWPLPAHAARQLRKSRRSCSYNAPSVVDAARGRGRWATAESSRASLYLRRSGAAPSDGARALTRLRRQSNLCPERTAACATSGQACRPRAGAKQHRGVKALGQVSFRESPAACVRDFETLRASCWRLAQPPGRSKKSAGSRQSRTAVATPFEAGRHSRCTGHMPAA
jgi:hypothetical protein